MPTLDKKGLAKRKKLVMQLVLSVGQEKANKILSDKDLLSFFNALADLTK